MGNDFPKPFIGAHKPINTLRRKHPIEKSSSIVHEHSVKRKRLSPEVTSRYFSRNEFKDSKNKKDNEEALGDSRSESSPGRIASVRTNSVSKHTLSSTSGSHGHNRPANIISKQFQNSFSPLPKRERWSRRGRRSSQSSDGSFVHMSSRLSQSPATNSPDILAGGPFGDAVPARDVSDLGLERKNGKRYGQSFSLDIPGPRIKRIRNQAPKAHIDISDDELSRDTAVPVQETQNVDTLHTPSRRTAKSNADITPTVFKRHDHDSSQSALCMQLARAVSGQHVYVAADDPRGAVYLCQIRENRPKLLPRSNGRDRTDLEWLELDVSKAKTVRYSPKSPCVALFRSSTSRLPSLLRLEFHSISDASNFAKLISHTVETSPDNLKKIMEKSMDDALSFIANQAASRRSSQNTSLDPPASPWSVEHNEANKTEHNSQKPQKNKDLMKKHLDRETGSLSHPDSNKEVVSNLTGPETRRTRRSIPMQQSREASPEKWTDLNPGWRDKWRNSLVFPTTGKNRATVDADDIARLDEGEFLNDNLISFYLRYLQWKIEKNQPTLLQKVYFFNSFFFEKLRSGKSKINYDGVKNWTAKIDLLSYDYIVVPVNENAHWYLAVICNISRAVQSVVEQRESEDAADITRALENREHTSAPNSPILSMVESQLSVVSLEDEAPRRNKGKKKAYVAPGELSSPTATGPSETYQDSSRVTPKKGSETILPNLNLSQPKIVTLDSLGSPHSPTCKALKDYLVEEAKHKKGIDISQAVPSGMTARGIPSQNNFCDCGIYVLGYMEEFLKQPDEAARKLLSREPTEWNLDATEMRINIRNLLFDLQAEQQNRLDMERQLRREKKKSRPSENPQRYLGDSETPTRVRRHETTGEDAMTKHNQSEKLDTQKGKFDCGNDRAKGGSTNNARISTDGYLPSLTTPGEKPTRKVIALDDQPIFKPPLTPTARISSMPKMNFVEPLSTPSPASKHERKAEEDHQITVISDSELPVSPKRVRKCQPTQLGEASFMRPLQSIEMDDNSVGSIDRHAQYDGIDHGRASRSETAPG